MIDTKGLFDISGRVALVTGAGSGIGRHIAVGFAQHNVAVACLDCRTDGELLKTVEMITLAGGNALALSVDVTKKEHVDRAIKHTEAELGALKIAVNAAGIANANPAESMTEEQYQTLIDINLKGIFLSCQSQAMAMLKHGQGSIINIASMSGVIVNRGLMQAHYNASKAGVIHLSKSMAMEWVTGGIRVNCISPGYTATPMNTRPEMLYQTKEFKKQTPMGRMASPNEMVGPAIFLASDASSYCTGVNLLVDGGFCCW